MKKICLVLGLIIVALPVLAENPQNLTAQEIVEKVDEREDGETRISDLKMVLINKAGEKRTRIVKSRQKDYDRDSKMLMTFVKPADVKGTGYLAWEFDNPDKADSRWIFLPALRKIRRISSSYTNEYFMGTDFTYDDMGDRNPDEDTHQLLGVEKVNGQSCWKIASTPKEKDDEYTKKIVWIRQDIFMAVKVKYYNEYGLLKILQVKDIELINDVWIGKTMVMDNKQDNHRTELYFENIKIDESISDKLFRPTTMKRSSVRY